MKRAQAIIRGVRVVEEILKVIEASG